MKLPKLHSQLHASIYRVYEATESEAAPILIVEYKQPMRAFDAAHAHAKLLRITNPDAEYFVTEICEEVIGGGDQEVIGDGRDET